MKTGSKEMENQHDDDVRANVARTTRDVGDHDGSIMARATKPTIQRRFRSESATSKSPC